MTVVKTCVIVTFIQVLVVHTAQGARQFASELKSRNITHTSVVLEWLPPDNVTIFFNYKLTVFDDNSRVVRNRVIDDSSQTSIQIRQLNIWTNYTVRLITCDVQNEALGTQWHSFSTRFFIVNTKTLLAIAALFFISLCYILALIFKFKCNFDEDDGKWRRQLIEDYQRQRIEKKARMQKYQRKKNSIKRQFSSLLIWRRHESSTTSDDSVKENTSLDYGQGTQITKDTNDILHGPEEDCQPQNGEIKSDTAEMLHTCGVDETDEVISVASDDFINTAQYSNEEESQSTDEQDLTPDIEPQELKEELHMSDENRDLTLIP
ncbi:hypothetical protein HOLleu_38964 [Holothuria leucospilota]|uniref:Fibronectin type-III domain-containing protein n=1 Tax=Holothuria leucospilota TaxID=206669 RepID=A0A9Q0YFF9_HOLLE|nr:hypothetical protein HOLleu_38964 [Holothuria leucospilota]